MLAAGLVALLLAYLTRSPILYTLAVVLLGLGVVFAVTGHQALSLWW